MFADMGIQPAVTDAILASQGLVRATASNDHVGATSTLNNLPDSVGAQTSITISGVATDDDNNPSTTDGRVALVPLGSERYAELAADTSVKQVKAMRSSRKK